MEAHFWGSFVFSMGCLALLVYLAVKDKGNKK